MRTLDLASERSQRIDSHDSNTYFADLLQDAQALGASGRATLRCAAYLAWLESQLATADAAAIARFLRAADIYELTLPKTHLGRAELALMRAQVAARDTATRAQAAAQERAGQLAWKTALGIEYVPPLLGLH